MSTELVDRVLAAIEEFDGVPKRDPSGYCDALVGRHLDAEEVHRWAEADRELVEQARTALAEVDEDGRWIPVPGGMEDDDIAAVESTAAAWRAVLANRAAVYGVSV